MNKNIIYVDERVLRSFTSYALGRMTYVPNMVQDVVKHNVHILSNYELVRLRSLIFYCENLGHNGIDDITWKQTQTIIETEIFRRIKDNIKILERTNLIAIDKGVLGFAIRGGLKSTGEDFKYLIKETITNADKLSLSTIKYILRDIEEHEIYGTKEEHISYWMELYYFLNHKSDELSKIVIEKNN